MALVQATTEEQGTAGDPDGAQQKVSTIDITSIKTKRPLLLSTLQEVLRFRHIGVSTRTVLQDEQLLDGKYHLKKDSVLMIRAHTRIPFRPDSLGAPQFLSSTTPESSPR